MSNILVTLLIIGHTFLYGLAVYFFKVSNINFFGVKLALLPVIKSAIGISFFGASFLVMLFLLHNLKVSFILPILLALSIIAQNFIGLYLLNENVSNLHFLGIAFIVIGIFFINL